MNKIKVTFTKLRLIYVVISSADQSIRWKEAINKREKSMRTQIITLVPDNKESQR